VSVLTLPEFVPPGVDVLTTADGRMTVARDNGDLCGLVVVVDHDFDGYRTVYCDLPRLPPGSVIASSAANTSGLSVHLDSAHGRASSTNCSAVVI
jgi:hypothetical protein